MEHLVKSVIESLIEHLKNPPSDDGKKCESRIEEDFLWALSKVTNDDVRIRRQCNVDTAIGRFRLDFILERPGEGRTIGVECDGKDFHSPERDAKRDAAIVASGMVNKIYRITGHDIVFHLADSIQILSILEPWIISERGAINLAAQSHPEELREDHFGRSGLFFPYTAARFYERPDDEDSDDEQISFRPTFIHWTQNEER